MGKLKGKLKDSALKSVEQAAKEAADAPKQEAAPPPPPPDPFVQAVERARFSLTDLTLAEIRLLGSGLGFLPMNQAYPLTQKLTQQIAAQENAIVAGVRATQTTRGRKKRAKK